MCDAEKERIMDYLKKENRPKRHIALKTICTAAACFVLLVTASVCSPVLAKSIPFMENIVAFIKQEKLPQSSIIQHSSVDKLMKTVDEEIGDDLHITETYCDGVALVLSICLDRAEMDADILRIDPQLQVEINGEKLLPDTMSSPGMCSLYRTENNRFAGSLVLDVRELNLTEDFPLTLTMKALTGVNPKRMVLSDNPGSGYVEKTYPLTCDYAPHTFTVATDTTQTHEYTVEKSVEDFVVHRIITSPACTYIDIYAPGRAYFFTITDQDGNELTSNKFDNPNPNAAPTNPNPYRSPLPLGTKKVIFTVYHREDEHTPIGTIEIPVKCGYDAEFTERSTQPTYDVVVYDPPLQIEEVIAPRKGEEEIPLGETIISHYGSESADATAEITYSNMQIHDSAADIGLTQTDMRYENVPLKQEGYKFVTFDVAITTKAFSGSQAIALADEIAAYEDNDGTTGMLSIDDYAHCYPRYQKDVGSLEIAYFSGHMNGMSNYYHFATNAYDTHDFVVGFYVSDALLSSGNWVIGVLDGEKVSPSILTSATWNGSIWRETYYTIPPIDLD